MPGPHPSCRAPRHHDGFTLIELLVTVAILGILAATAIPVLLHQKAAARNAAVDAALSTIAKTVETLDISGDLARTSDGVLNVNGERVTDVPTAGDIAWNVSGTPDSYCLVAYSTAGGKYTADSPRTYDSQAGGIGHEGAACPADATRAPVAFAVARTGTLGGLNTLRDSSFRALSFAPRTTNYQWVAPFYSATIETIDTPTPVGSRAVQVTARVADKTQGVVFFQIRNGVSTDKPVLIKQAGEKWALSLWVKGKAGRAMSLGPRLNNLPGWNYVREGFWSETLPTDDWYRLTGVFTSTSADVGQHLAVQVRWVGTTDVGDTFLVAGPQIERADTPSLFQPTLPFP